LIPELRILRGVKNLIDFVALSLEQAGGGKSEPERFRTAAIIVCEVAAQVAAETAASAIAASAVSRESGLR
jgi:hypothetical protein